MTTTEIEIPGFTGHVTTGGPDFAIATEVWNRARPSRPALVAHCAATDDVAAALRYAAREGLAVSVRAGGHSYVGASIVEGGLVIDLRAMRSVSYDEPAGVVRVGGGARWGEVDDVLGPLALATAGGSVSKVGVAGFTLGTGFGWLGRTHGTAGDNLEGATVVTAVGDVLEASAEEHPDLFWALRGGCGNFGVVTEFRFGVHPVGTVLAGPLIYRVEDAPAVLRHLAEGAATLDPRLSCTAVLTTAPALAVIPPELVGQTVLLMPLLWVGDHVEAEPHLAALRGFGEPVADLVGAVAFSEFQRASDDAAPDGLCWDVRSEWLSDLDDASIEAAVASALTAVTPLSEVLFRVAGGSLEQSPATTPFSFGHARYLLEVIGNWAPGDDSDAVRAWMRRAWRDQVHTTAGGPCVNHIGFGEEPDRVRRAYSSATYARLREVKGIYDPTNVFSSVQNIAP